jgi:hypothetical protein
VVEFLKRFKNLDAINNSKLIPDTIKKIALTKDYILYKTLLTEVVKTFVNGTTALQNENRIRN